MSREVVEGVIVLPSTERAIIWLNIVEDLNGIFRLAVKRIVCIIVAVAAGQLCLCG